MSKTDLFDFPLEENNDENVEEKEEESSSSEEEPGEEEKEEQNDEEESSSSEEEEEMDDDERWKPLREKVGRISKNPTCGKKSNSSWIGENPRLCWDSRFQCPITCK